MNPNTNPFDSMDRLFDQMRRSMLSGDRTGGGMNLRTETTEDGYVVLADLPGFEKDDVTVRFEDGMLTITAMNEATEESEFASRTRSRRLQDGVRIPSEVLEDEITATYHNGVLELTLPTVDAPTDDEHVIEIN